jgi:hypothetical protein
MSRDAAAASLTAPLRPAFLRWEPRRTHDEGEATPPPALLQLALKLLILGIVLTPRVGFAIGDSTLGLSLPLTCLFLAVLLHTGDLALDVASLALYCAFAVVACASYAFNASAGITEPPSIASLALLLALYLPFVLTRRPGAHTAGQWRWMMGFYADVLLFVALVGIAQFYLQFVYRPDWLFDPSILLPPAIRGQGIYNTAISTGSFLKANGLFSREPSGFSFLAAFGLLVEWALFKRKLRMLCLLLALLLSYSGTGLLALGIALLFPLRLRLLLVLGAAAGVLLALEAALGDPLNLALTFARVGEFASPGSSAYQRYISPMLLVDANLLSTPWAPWIGHGPGMIQKIWVAYDSHDPTWAKLLFEYGVLGFITCLTLMVFKFASPAIPLRLRAVLFFCWLVMGGHLLSPELVCLLYVLLAVWPREAPPPLKPGAPA